AFIQQVVIGLIVPEIDLQCSGLFVGTEKQVAIQGAGCEFLPGECDVSPRAVQGTRPVARKASAG
ncbi:unnamed protein product, partial [marine sediment metagenome]